MECLKVNDFCFLKKNKSEKHECIGEYNESCYGNLCAKYNCQIIMLFRALKNIHKYVNNNNYNDFKKEYDSFINQIKDCPEPPKLNSNDYCLSKQNRYLSCISTSARIWSFTQIKQNECKCTGKYSYRCNNEYCAKNKQACDDLRNRSINGIKNCKS